MYNHQDSTHSVHSKRNEAHFPLGIWIFRCNPKRISQDLLGVREAYLMLG
jgi:hypothetical protein